VTGDIIELRSGATPTRRTDRRLPCQREDPRLWFAERPADLNRAKAHCRECPVRAACLAGALERQEPHGVWGGEIFQLGSIIAEKRPRGRPRKHPLTAVPDDSPRRSA
jgi:WhiB family redox-sensing transcriptional regulator